MMKSDMSYCRKTAVEQVISDFLFHCQYEKNLNEKTIYAYRSDLYMFKGIFMSCILRLYLSRCQKIC